MVTNLAFKKHIPSVFVVCSPFQVLSAVEAVREFEIEDYLFFVHINANERNRIDQTFKILDEFHVKYETIDFIKSWSKIRLLKALIPRFSKYKRAFIGHFRVDYLFHTAFSHISNNSVVVYLDDGMNCLTLLDNSFTFGNTFNHKIIDIASKLRNINYHKHLFTIYSDFDIKNKKLNIYKNTFKNISFNTTVQQDDSVFIIGTVVDDYCKAAGISVNNYLSSLETIFKNLRSKNEFIYYFPHGRDNNSNIKLLCDRHDIKCIRPSSTIEMFMFDAQFKPKSVYGFSSSALFNIKLFFPQIDIFNYMYNNNQEEGYETIAKYYEKHGIKTIYYQ